MQRSGSAQVGGVTPTMSSKPVIVPSRIDLREVKGIVLFRMDGRCQVWNQLYMAVVDVGLGGPLSLYISQEHVIDVLATTPAAPPERARTRSGAGLGPRQPRRGAGAAQSR